MTTTAKVRVNLTRRPIDDFARDLELELHDGELRMNASIGSGDNVRYHIFPDGLEFYHFGNTRFSVPIAINTVNPSDSDWFLIHVNLSATKQDKKIDGQTIEFQKRLPIGIMVYGPGLEIDTVIPPGVDSELASIRFNRALLDAYFSDSNAIATANKNLICEDLDYLLQEKLSSALETIDNKLLCHANVLMFMNQLFEKLGRHAPDQKSVRLRGKEIDSLFLASTHLRDPVAERIPSVKELAAIANMSVTKFKSSFKQIFGSAPMQYRNKIRMEFAREEIVANRRTPTEISYLLGYSHPSNFTAAYKKIFGELPSADWRK